MKSLFEQETVSQDWIKDFYTQAGNWWGKDPQAKGTHETRVKLIERFCGPGEKRILDLGAGPGQTMAALADAGHTVIGVEFNPTDADYAKELFKKQRKGSITYHEADFFTVKVDGRFDAVTCWQVFGLGNDADQRRLLKRIAMEWLAPAGCVLLDVYHPAGPARDNGKEWHLSPLTDVPGSVEMIERCSYDPVQGRWVDEWQPVANPENKLAQSLRCYTPVDLMLLLEGTGLCLKHAEIEGEKVDIAANCRTGKRNWFSNDYNYLVQLVKESTDVQSKKEYF